jgi:hypothetical protein
LAAQPNICRQMQEQFWQNPSYVVDPAVSILLVRMPALGALPPLRGQATFDRICHFNRRCWWVEDWPSWVASGPSP